MQDTCANIEEANRKPYLVSCIIPTCNRAQLLPRAVCSVREQTWKHLEIIIINDASEDNTAEIIHELEAEDSRIRSSNSPTPLGGGAARNLGLSMAGGEVIAYLDDDDEWMPWKLASQISHVDDFSVVGCLSMRADAFSMKSLHAGEDLAAADGLQRAKQTVITLNDVYYDNGRLSPTVAIAKAENLRAIGGFDEELAASQGRDLFIRLIKAFGPGLMVELVGARHFQRHGQHRITDSSSHLLGGWQEFNKHKDIMPPKCRRWRKFILCMKEYRRCRGLRPSLQWLGRAMGNINPLWLGRHLKTMLYICFFG